MWLLLVAVFPVTIMYAAQRQLDHLKAERSADELFRYLPKADFLKVAVLGYDQLAADMLWLKAIQVMGTKGREAEDAEWVYQALDVVTTLDPRFDYAYELGGIFLSVLGGRADLAAQLLAKGALHNRDVWRIHFYLGFNHFYYLGNFKIAADAMAKAADLPGRPDFVPLLASRLYAHAEEPQLALDFLDRMYELNKDEQVRAQLLVRIKEVAVERDLRILNRTVEQFKEHHQRLPAQLEELVSAGLLNGLPEEPFGGHYYVDRADQQVKSSTQMERLRVELPEQRLGAPQQPVRADTP